jgi:hypothetical protein
MSDAHLMFYFDTFARLSPSLRIFKRLLFALASLMIDVPWTFYYLSNRAFTSNEGKLVDGSGCGYIRALPAKDIN